MTIENTNSWSSIGNINNNLHTYGIFNKGVRALRG